MAKESESDHARSDIFEKDMQVSFLKEGPHFFQSSVGTKDECFIFPIVSSCYLK